MDADLIDRITRIAAEVGDDDFARTAPPPDLWARISAAASADQPADGNGEGDGEAERDDDDVSSAEAGVDAPAATVVSLDQRRRHMNRRIVVAVAASLVLLVGTGVLLTRGGSSPDPHMVASASLEALESVEPAPTTAAVRVVSNGDDLRLVLSARDMTAAPTGHHYELWLLDPADGEPLTLGAMSGSVSVPVPAGVDLDTYDVVDVSVQADGQIEHSGDSVLRGTLA